LQQRAISIFVSFFVFVSYFWIAPSQIWAKDARTVVTVREAGRRLGQMRAAAGLSIEAAARAVGASRALLYRYEAGEIVKLATLERLARLYGTTATAILSAGPEYLTNGLQFFEQVERLEQEAEHITVVFGPIAYALTTDAYDQALFQALAGDDRPGDGRPGDGRPSDGRSGDGLSAGDLERLRRALRRRKAVLRTRRPSFVNIVPVAEIRRYLENGLGVRDGGTAAERAAARRAAVKEMDHLASLIAKPPMGVQIGLTARPLPTAGFQLLRIRTGELLVTSPFRLGEPLNLHYGVAMISGEDEALRLHETLAARLWSEALMGNRAIDEIQRLIRLSRG